MSVVIRPATLRDLPAITAIYNDAVLHSTATFDVEPKTPAEQEAWFYNHGPRYPVLVAEQGGTVVGWASLSPFAGRCAYRITAEPSLYVDAGHQRQGVGRRLLEAVLAAGEQLGYHSVVARITAENAASLRLSTLCGLQEVGRLREVGEKFGRRLDVHLLQKVFPADAPR